MVIESNSILGRQKEQNRVDFDILWVMSRGNLVHPIRYRSRRKYVVISFLILVLIAFFVFLNSKTVDKSFLEKIVNTQTPVPFKQAPVSYELSTSVWVPQTFNNCAPAATSMVLQHFGFSVSQEKTKADLRTNADDKNVFIDEVSNYLKNDYNIGNKLLFNGSLNTIKTLVANDIYVVVEDWLHPNEDIGHVLIIRGFDDNERVLIADDSFFGVGIKYPYDIWEAGQWKPYNREYMPVYNPEKEDLVKSIVGKDWDFNTMYEGAIAKNLQDVNENQGDMYAWFNLGRSYFYLGDYEKARQAFEKSQSIGWPHRMLWYFVEPVLTYNKLGLYKQALATADIGLWSNDNYAEMHFEKYITYQGLGENDLAQNELQKAIELDPNISAKMSNAAFN